MAEKYQLSLAEVITVYLASQKKYLEKKGYRDVTNSEANAILQIGNGKPRRIGEIADDLLLTKGTLSITMNSLVKKGYAIKRRGMSDKRAIYISLTPMGEKVLEVLTEFHEETVMAYMKNQTPEGEKVLYDSYQSLMCYLRGEINYDK